MVRKITYWMGVLGVLFGSECQAMGISLDDVVPNFIGVGAGATTQWHGSKDTMVGAVPGARFNLGAGRFAEWYGPYLGANLLTDNHWEAGPVLNIRLGRSDVDDPVVALLPEIGAGLEAGGFVGWHYLNTAGIPYRVRTGLMAVHSIAGQTEGANFTPYASIWVPLSPKVFVGLGTGATWADSDYMQQFFGVGQQASADSGLSEYSAGAGWRQTYLWPAVMWRLSDRWMAGGGLFYQYLIGDAADSPIISERGDRRQLSGGLGLGYLW